MTNDDQLSQGVGRKSCFGGRQESRNTGSSTKWHERPIIDRKQLTQKTATKIRDMLRDDRWWWWDGGEEKVK